MKFIKWIICLVGFIICCLLSIIEILLGIFRLMIDDIDWLVRIIDKFLPNSFIRSIALIIFISIITKYINKKWQVRKWRQEFLEEVTFRKGKIRMKDIKKWILGNKYSILGALFLVLTGIWFALLRIKNIDISFGLLSTLAGDDVIYLESGIVIADIILVIVCLFKGGFETLEDIASNKKFKETANKIKSLYEDAKKHIKNLENLITKLRNNIAKAKTKGVEAKASELEVKARELKLILSEDDKLDASQIEEKVNQANELENKINSFVSDYDLKF